jgi:hypothetical protein
MLDFIKLFPVLIRSHPPDLPDPRSKKLQPRMVAKLGNIGIKRKNYPTLAA